MELQNTRVLVTGASRGIGASLARAFADAGARVALAARSIEELDALAYELGGSSYPLDVTDPDQLDGFVQRVEADGGPIDVLVNNAGIETQDFVEDIDEDHLTQVVATNLLAPLRLTRQALPGMIRRGQGHLLYTSSLAAITPAPGLAPYGASKAGLTRFTESLRMEVKNTGVHVTTMHLGPVDTDMWDRVISNPAFDAAQRRLRQLHMLANVSPDKVASDAVEAVRKEKREVRHPKRLWVTMALAALPGRITEFLVGGVDYRLHKNRP
ncbi:MAG: SDR family NAD(P)-dependent oxidoreductase [Actinomycetota bacterium]|mgnify:FL=1|nr:SDR family NAD(P)-dependent oxidoreductase [Acidimicrobiales bacterium]MEC9316384.1 SDR family NAD(P)-dependent oxidoreductase [Actinomycetota bacterium]MED5551157.1 SDR family NAD(P)-dependent oxidoreductase [Actinomycetota bacterium]|tara:strand:+ start:79 stop:885 length:807 start_codon:yes stop_codon:yes gene_type:complete